MVYILLSAKKRAYFCKSIAIEMGGVSQYFSDVSGSGVNLTLLNVCVCNYSGPSGIISGSGQVFRQSNVLALTHLIACVYGFAAAA